MEKILTTASGRYKVLKLVQYIARFILVQASSKRIRLSLATRERLRTLIGQCSLQRRVLQLGNLYRPLRTLSTISSSTNASSKGDVGGGVSALVPSVSYKGIDWHALVATIAEVTEEVSEDAYTLAQLGWIPHRFTKLAVYADRAWLISLVLELRVWALDKHRIMRKKRMARLLDQSPDKEVVRLRGQELREEEWWLDLDGLRTMCDTGQAWCDVFDVQVFEGFNVYCALTSAMIGLYRFVGK